MTGNTLASLSYGISRPEDLLEKLKSDGERLGAQPHPYDVFNFIVTSAVLNEWIRKVHKTVAEVDEFRRALDTNSWRLLPASTEDWIVQRTHILTTGPDVRLHVLNVLQLTWHTANASKHFHWTNSSGVTDIQPAPIVRSWYQYFFTSRAEDLYVEYEGHTYGLSEVRLLLEQFFAGFLKLISGTGHSA